MKSRLPPALADDVAAAAADWRREERTRRLFAGDATLWTGGDEARWLGWLEAPERARSQLDLWREIARDARGFARVLVLGMGGSSLAPLVQHEIVPGREGSPELEVLDSIHPDAIAATERRLDLARTLVVVASKSGTTLEPNLLLAYFLDRMAGRIGAAEAPRRFVAVTDPGSALERQAREQGFRRVVTGEPTIGGRFSALSPFGLAPAAMQGIAIDDWLERAVAMANACREEDPLANPGVALGLVLGAAARQGRDKLTLVAHPRLAPFGAWLEQLVAESTGKRGIGILPIDGEELAAPSGYGDDRLFVALRSSGELGDGDAAALDALAAAGQPVVELDLVEPEALAGELYRWELATAVAGSLLGVDPFDQPDVESAKVAARRLTAELEATGRLPEEEPFAAEGGCALFAPEGQVRLLRSAAGPRAGVAEHLGAHLRRLGEGDYFALLLFVPISAATIAAAERIRRAVRRATPAATTIGFGPRYLHSTGQAHKGGPASGLFLVVGDHPERDLAVPGQRLTFGQAIAAQARGDFAVLAERGRRALRVALDGPAEERLESLAAAIERSLGR